MLPTLAGVEPATSWSPFEDIVDGNRQLMLPDICNVKGHSYRTVPIPRLLNNDHRGNQNTMSRKFLQCYCHKGTDFLDIVTTDETWIYLYDLKTKEQS